MLRSPYLQSATDFHGLESPIRKDGVVLEKTCTDFQPLIHVLPLRAKKQIPSVAAATCGMTRK